MLPGYDSIDLYCFTPADHRQPGKLKCLVCGTSIAIPSNKNEIPQAVAIHGASKMHLAGILVGWVGFILIILILHLIYPDTDEFVSLEFCQNDNLARQSSQRID